MKWQNWVLIVLTGLFTTTSFPPVFGESVTFQKLERPTYDLFYAVVPANNQFQVKPLVSSKLALLPALLEPVQKKVVVAVNGGFFDPANQETTSYVRLNSKIALDPTHNKRFMENPDLAPYIPSMLNRSEFRVLSCGNKQTYDITPHNAATEFGCTLIDSIQAGPDLFSPNAAEKEAFVAYQGQTRSRDPLGVDNKNARSAIGIDATGNVILAMASMKALGNKMPSGITLSEMAAVMKTLGAVKALSLDGGSSATFWINGQTYYGKRSKTQTIVKRPIKSALVVLKED